MTLVPLVIHLGCLFLVAADLLARSVRLRSFNRALGQTLSLRDAFAATILGDAGCGLTPMRLGGEPARVAMLVRAGIPLTATAVVVAVELVTSWPVVLLSAAVIAALFAPVWFDTAAPGLLAGLGQSWIWGTVLLAMSVVVWLVARRLASRPANSIGTSFRQAWGYARSLPPGTYALGAALAFVNLASRVLLLPLLLQLLPDPPAFGPALLGSFALLYAQLALPTPSGVGVVDLGFLAGAAGPLGEQGALLLLWWRFYSSGIGIGLGLWMAARIFGWAGLRRIFLAFRPASQ